MQFSLLAAPPPARVKPHISSSSIIMISAHLGEFRWASPVELIAVGADSERVISAHLGEFRWASPVELIAVGADSERVIDPRGDSADPYMGDVTHRRRLRRLLHVWQVPAWFTPTDRLIAA